LFLGDSLTAGYGLSAAEAYPSLLQKRWDKRGLPWKARNAGVSGATTAGTLESLSWSLTPDVKLVFLAVGANDGLRGLPLDRTRQNLAAIIERCRAAGARVALAGMKIPPNYGEEYAAAFEKNYAALAARYKLKLLPFLLQDVAGRRDRNLEDGIHPNSEGHRIIADNVDAFFSKEKLLK
jgi:acyl-CoA thioesterase-1